MSNKRQLADGSAAFINDLTGAEALRVGGPKPVGAPASAGGSVPDFRPGTVLKMGPFAGVAATTGGAIGSWTNTLGYDVIVTEAVVDVTTQSTGAANLSVGQTATNATTSSTNFLSAVAVGSAGVKQGALTTAVKVKNGEFVTLTGSADTTGLVANLYLRAFPV